MYVDAGIYHGDGAFFVDGGAYPDAGPPPDASNGMDAGVDAAPGCGPLAACCSTLSSGSQVLCNEVVADGNATACATELTELGSGGECTGVAILATQGQVPANELVSDGTTLFWTTNQTPGLLAMPVGGGAVTILLEGSVGNQCSGGIPGDEGCFFLAVDDLNVYVLENNSLIRIPKNGSAATLVNEPGGMVVSATSLGTIAYWAEPLGSGGVTVMSAPMFGGSPSLVASFNT